MPKYQICLFDESIATRLMPQNYTKNKNLNQCQKKSTILTRKYTSLHRKKQLSNCAFLVITSILNKLISDFQTQIESEKSFPIICNNFIPNIVFLFVWMVSYLGDQSKGV